MLFPCRAETFSDGNFPVVVGCDETLGLWGSWKWGRSGGGGGRGSRLSIHTSESNTQADESIAQQQLHRSLYKAKDTLKGIKQWCLEAFRCPLILSGYCLLLLYQCNLQADTSIPSAKNTSAVALEPPEDSHADKKKCSLLRITFMIGCNSCLQTDACNAVYVRYT